MDALVLTQANKRPVFAIAQLFGVPENRLWRAINAPTEAASSAFHNMIYKLVAIRHAGSGNKSGGEHGERNMACPLGVVGRP